MGRRLSSPTLVGRGSELAELEAALDRADTVDATLAIVEGEAGIGKTRLVAQLADAARARDAVVLSGAAVEVAGGSLPYSPFVGILRELASALPPEDLVQILAATRRLQLTSLVPELGLLPWPGPQPPVEPAISDQTQMFENILGVAERLGRIHLAVIILEDLQWADRSTLDLILFLERNVRSGRVLMVITYRSDAVGADDPLEHVLGELSRDRRTVRISLEPLSAAATAEQIQQIAGEVAPEVVARIHSLSDGNPFFVEELVAADPSIHPRGRDGPPEGADGTRSGEAGRGAVPVSLRRLLLDRYRQLSETARAVCRIVAVVGAPAPEELIGHVGELLDRELYGALREALDEHVLVLVETPLGDRYGFRHALLGEAIAGDLLPGERRQLHAAIAAHLTEFPADAAAASASATIAFHWAAAGRWPEAIASSVAAGQAAMAIGAYAEAQGQLDRALDIWPRVDGAPELAGMTLRELLDLAADAAFLAGDFDGAVRVARRSLATISAEEPTVEAANAHRRLGSFLSAANDDAAAADELARALTLLPADAPMAARARMLSGQGATLMLLGRYRESADACRTAIGAAIATGERTLEAGARNFLGVDLACLGQADAGLEELRRATEIGAASGPADSHLEAVHNYAGMLDYVGRSAEGVEMARAGIARAREAGLERRSGAGLHSVLGLALYRLGRWDEAESVLRAGLELDPRGEHLVSLLRERGRLHVGLGRMREAAALLEAAAGAAVRDRRVDSQTWLAEARAELAIWEGRIDDARRIVSAALGRLDGTDEMLRAAPLCAVGLRAEADRAELARARRSSSDLAAAAATADGLVARARAVPGVISGFGGQVGPVSSAELSWAEAERRRVDGPTDAAMVTDWLDIAGAFAAIPMPYPEAYARFRAAEAALIGRHARDVATAELTRAADLSEHLGAQPLVKRVHELARRARIDLVPAAATADARPAVAAGQRPPEHEHGSESAEAAAKGLGLTRREVEILGLVAEGYTNRRIAEALFITEKTAGVHLTNIFGKLEVSNRVEAGAIARRLGLVGAVGGSVVRTFMFTDIVRSTNLIEAIGDAAWVDLLGWHDRTLRAAFVRAGGEEIDHAGDGFFVAFLTPEAAAGCAIAIQRALAEHRRAHGFAPGVRIGIHEGEAVRTAGGYAGRAIHEAARLAVAAGAGEIVASGSTRLPTTISAGRARKVELRGLAEAVDVVRIEWGRAS